MKKLTLISIMLIFAQMSCAQAKQRPLNPSLPVQTMEATSAVATSQVSSTSCQSTHPFLKSLKLCVGYRWLQHVEDKWIKTDKISTMDDESVLQVWFYSPENSGGIVKINFPLKVFLYMKMTNGSSHPGPKGKIIPLQDGSFRIHSLQFFMPEQWQIHIQALQADGKTVMDSAFFEQWVE
jgi:hypothetical protein